MSVSGGRVISNSFFHPHKTPISQYDGMYPEKRTINIGEIDEYFTAFLCECVMRFGRAVLYSMRCEAAGRRALLY